MAARHSAGVGCDASAGGLRAVRRRPCQQVGRPVRAITAAPAWRGVGQQLGFVNRVARPASSTRTPSIHTLWTPLAGAQRASWATGRTAAPIRAGRCRAARNRPSCRPPASRSGLPAQRPRAVHARHFEHRGRREELLVARGRRGRGWPSAAPSPGCRPAMPSVPSIDVDAALDHLRIEADAARARSRPGWPRAGRGWRWRRGVQARPRARSRRSAARWVSETFGPSTPMSARCSSGRRP